MHHKWSKEIKFTISPNSRSYFGSSPAIINTENGMDRTCFQLGANKRSMTKIYNVEFLKLEENPIIYSNLQLLQVQVTNTSQVIDI